MSDGSGEIIIKGASVHVEFNGTIYKKDPNDPNKHDNANRKITKIVVVDESGAEKYNSGDNPGGLKWEVTVSTK
jgi:hypothetical protein